MLRKDEAVGGQFRVAAPQEGREEVVPDEDVETLAVAVHGHGLPAPVREEGAGHRVV